MLWVIFCSVTLLFHFHKYCTPCQPVNDTAWSLLEKQFMSPATGYVVCGSLPTHCGGPRSSNSTQSLKGRILNWNPSIIVLCPHFLWTKLATVAWKCPTLSLYWEDVPAWIIDHHARGNFPACVDGVSNQTLLYRIYLRIHSRFRDGAGRSSTGAFVELILFSFSAYCKTHPLNGAEDVVKHFSSM